MNGIKAKVTADLLRVRAQPSTDAPVLGMLSTNADVEVIEVSNGWATVALGVGGAPIRQENADGPVVAYLFAEYLNLGGVLPDQPPQPLDPTIVSTGSFKLGINALTNTGLAMREADNGCKYFLIMDDFLGASELKQKHPDAVVMVRRWFGGGRPSVDNALNRLEGAANPNLVYIGTNEADQYGQEGKDLEERARFDVELARRIKEKSGATYAAGTISMGCPDFTNPKTCDIVREMYAPHYNSGLIGFDMHLYSPNMQHIDQPDEWQWFERRWEFLFTRCGFDPNVRAIYSSETGVDEGSVGGFSAHNATQEQFRYWCDKFTQVQQMPLIVNGQAYPSPVVGGAIFQLGGNNDPRWRGYDIQDYLGEFRKVWVVGVGRGLKAAKRSAARAAKKVESGPKKGATKKAKASLKKRKS
jgi:hypothetical protein